MTKKEKDPNAASVDSATISRRRQSRVTLTSGHLCKSLKPTGGACGHPAEHRCNTCQAPLCGYHWKGHETPGDCERTV